MDGGGGDRQGAEFLPVEVPETVEVSGNAAPAQPLVPKDLLQDTRGESPTIPAEGRFVVASRGSARRRRHSDLPD